MMPIAASPAPAAIASAPSTIVTMRDPGRCLGALLQADRVAAGDVAELVRDDALQLVHIVGRLEQARLDIDRLARGDEGVDLGIVEQDDVDAVGVEAAGDDQRPRRCP